MKTLRLPTVARSRAGDDASPRVIGETSACAHARRVLAACAWLEGVGVGGPLVLVAPDALGDVSPRQLEDGTAVWVLLDDGPPPELGGAAITGVVRGPLTSAVLLALRPPAADPGDGRSLGRLGAIVGGSLLDDLGRFGDDLARAFDARAAHLYLADGAELRPLTAGDATAPSGARLAADLGVPVVEHASDTAVTWLAQWCARTPVAERTGLLALEIAGGTQLPPRALAELDLLATRVAVELAWLRVHRRLVADQERLRTTAMLDPLTGAWTRAAFERTVEVEVAAARRRDEALALAVFDIEGLGRINTRYGHDIGDAVLCHTVAVLRAGVRVNDTVGRFGDDEIAVLLEGADAGQATTIVEKLVARLAEHPLLAGELVVPVAVRAGVTGFGPGERTGDAAFARAVTACEAAAASVSRVAVLRDSTVVPPGLGLDGDAQLAQPFGTTLGGCYRLLHEINRGASGVVYRGEDLGLNRPVAIKVLRHDLGRDAELIAHFRREASILASLRHPHLVEVYAFRADDDVYFVMELVEGPTAKDVVDDARREGTWLDPDGVATLVEEIAGALDTMHAAGLVHCDVKPENVVLHRSRRRAVLIDVGECKRLDERHRRAATPGYAAPESLSGGDETPATDVYALAATAYRMLTGELPHGAGDTLSILSRQLDAPPPPPSSYRRGLPVGVDAVLLRGLAVEPEDRYATASELAAALRRALRGAHDSGDHPVVGLAPDPEPATSPVTRHPATQAQVRGACFRFAAKALFAQLGEQWIPRVSSRPGLAALLAPSLPPMSWHPAPELRALVDGATGGGDAADRVLRMIGFELVSATFGQLFGAAPERLSPRAVLGGIPGLWPRYFAGTTVEIDLSAPTRCDLVVRGGAGQLPPALIAGFLGRIAELSGADAAEVTRDARGERFAVTWRS